MRYRIQHTTVYDYVEGLVNNSFGYAHVTPRALPWQELISHEITVDPSPLQTVSQHDDVYGNTASYFQVFSDHTKLSLNAVSEVEIADREYDEDRLAIPWEQARPADSDDANAWQAMDFMFPSPRLPASKAAVEYARASFAPGRPVGEAVVELMHRVYEDFTYKSGSTTVKTTVDEVMERRMGVCQDFSNVMVTGLRGLGLAACYVSGYLATTPPPGRPRLVGADATHAWVGCWVPGVEWIYLDPTNNRLTSATHATVAWGRDYGDVAPMRGVIYADDPTKSKLKVSVDMAPLSA